MIQEDYVSFEVAKLLKEKGFDEKCSHYYVVSSGHIKSWCSLVRKNNFQNNKDYIDTRYINVNKLPFVLAPTLQMAIKWLREVHKYLIVVGNKNGNYLYLIKDLKANTDLGISNDEYIRYEQACEEAIKYCLEKLI